jgi:hypothetical protein
MMSVALLSLRNANVLENEDEDVWDDVWEAIFCMWKNWRRDPRIPRCALQSPFHSAWFILFGSGNDQALITMTGFDHSTFRYLEDLFTPWFNNYTPWTFDGSSMRRLARDRSERLMGRPRLLDARIALGLTLVWTRTRGAERTLQMTFGLTRTPIGKWLNFGRRILVKILIHHPQARIALPHPDDIAVYKEAITRRHRYLQDVAFAADGLKLYLEASGDEPDLENAFYNGWQHSHFVSCVFVFAPDGTIPAAVLNAPGSWHDSSIADFGGLYRKLEILFHQYGAKTVIDSAFSRGNYPFLIKSSSEEKAQTAQERCLLRDATSLRQMSEWGMNGFQRSFPRMQDRLRWEDMGERKVILTLISLLYNFRSRRTGINQLLNVYMPNLSCEASTLLPAIFPVQA